MGVLLGLGDVELAEIVLGENIGERLRNGLLAEDDRAVEVVAVVGHRRQVDAGVEQQARELSAAVRAEVEEDRGVARLDPRRALDHDRLDELVGDTRVVARLHGLELRRGPGCPAPCVTASKARCVRSQRWSRSIA